jgi:hypothetical protein
MRLRISAGRTDHHPAEGLRTAWQSPGLLIQADEDVSAFELEDGRRLFVVGTAFPRDGGRSREMARYVGMFDSEPGPEGQLVLAIAAADGSCRLCSDVFGQRDVYWQPVPGGVVCATELALLPVSRHAAAVDQVALMHALCVYGQRPGKEETYYAEVRRLGLGQVLTVSGCSAVVTERPFRPLVTVPDDNGRHRASLDEYADLLLEATRVRASDAGNVVYLSSGWDSTAILACLVHLFGRSSVSAVIGRMQYGSRSGVINQFEIDRATRMAEFFGVPLEIVEFDYRERGPEQFEALLPMFRSHQVASLVGLNHALLAEAAARSGPPGRTVFAGEVSDGAHSLGFSQFVTIFHPVQAFREYSDKMNSYLFGPTFMESFRSGVFEQDTVYQLLRGRTGDAAYDSPAEHDGERVMQLLSAFFLRSTRLPLWSLENCRLLQPAGRVLYESAMQERYLARAAAEATPDTLYAWILHLYNAFHWQGSTVYPLLLTTEAHGLSLGMPFWDQALLAFLARMPESWGRGLELRPTKYPLKWMLANRIRYPMHLQVGPHSYLYDVNPNFSHAAELVYASAFTEYFKTVLGRREYHEVLSKELFDLRYVDGLVSGYLGGQEIRGAELNDLVSLALVSAVSWYR